MRQPSLVGSLAGCTAPENLIYDFGLQIKAMIKMGIEEEHLAVHTLLNALESAESIGICERFFWEEFGYWLRNVTPKTGVKQGDEWGRVVGMVREIRGRGCTVWEVVAARRG